MLILFWNIKYFKTYASYFLCFKKLQDTFLQQRHRSTMAWGWNVIHGHGFSGASVFLLAFDQSIRFIASSIAASFFTAEKICCCCCEVHLIRLQEWTSTAAAFTHNHTVLLFSYSARITALGHVYLTGWRKLVSTTVTSLPRLPVLN